uniref:DsgA protein n=1 Tax=Saccharothrix mutabilis subsp. capreolus TaxID=66854 RepID=Q8RJW7_STRMP|nr:dsgA protein [Saccharothrix mutabilis subsp. capreolus]
MAKATITATWSTRRWYRMPPAGAQGFDTDRLTWGTPSAGGEPNAYRFQGGTVEVPFDGSEFVLGTLTHANRPITDPEPFDVTLKTTMVHDDGQQQSFHVVFSHQETPDLNGPVDDIIFSPWIINDAQTVTVDGVRYVPIPTRWVFEGQQASPQPTGPAHFPSAEGRDNTAQLMAVMCRPDRPEMRITTVQHKGQVKRSQADEYVEIANLGVFNVDLAGWTVDAGDTGQDFTFPQFVLWPGQRCRVYTNQVHPQWGGFSFGSSRAIWNDTGDTATLRKPDKTVVAQYGYGDQAKP